MYSEENITVDGPEILIVEDSPTQAMELEFILKLNGYRTSVVGNGREALAWLSRKMPAMVISDIVMPELDGFELCRAIRKGEKHKNVPVILLSFLSDAADVLRGLESGASNFIIKPYSPDHLISCIQEKLSRCAAEEDWPLRSVTVEYAGNEYTISSGVRQVLDILVSTYGTAVRKNEELIRAETELQMLNEDLEHKVRQRTAALTAEIAERRRVEEELRKKSEKLIAYSARLEQSNRDLQDFAFIASHDLQEPVRKIQTFADRIMAQYTELLDEKGRDYLDRVRRSARRMQELILSLLKYSRLTSSSEHFFPQVDLTQSVKEALSDLKVLLEDSGAQIEIGTLPTVEADPVQMRQLFQNLLGNALKYRGEKTPVIRVYVEPGECEGFHEIRVEDNGIGFDQCYLDNIFKPFQRLHGKGAPYEGTGMGLAICRKIVERHGGSITARSKIQSGAVFMVRLPEKQS
ncbi:MAG: ATP-binding protein [Syntrophobacteraceae bacterium]|jgi:light-regulated signal transduction histidine kinase (bacteriophytochrome)/ActR/RegA family two-component response regulator